MILFHDILYFHTRGVTGREVQIDCLATRSVIVMFGRWINDFDGCCSLKQRHCLHKDGRDWFGPWGAEWLCGVHVRLLGFVAEGDMVRNVSSDFVAFLQLYFFCHYL